MDARTGMELPLDDIDGVIAPAEAFAILGDATRLSILRTLWEADEPLSYTDLRRRVAYEGEGNFSYHLDRVLGHFVRKTDGDYDLRYAGEQVVRAVVAGTLTADPSIGQAVVDEACPYCGAPVELEYHEETLTVTCTECEGAVGDTYPEGTLLSYGFPPGGLVDRSPTEVIDAAHTLYDGKILPMMNGVCPECAGTVAVEVDVCDDHRAAGGLCETCQGRFAAWAEYRCDRCRYRRRSAVWFEALNHPAVVSFYHEHAGLEETVPFRKLTAENAPLVRGITETVRSTDPLRFRVEIPLESARLVVDLDDSLDVVAVDRSDT